MIAVVPFASRQQSILIVAVLPSADGVEVACDVDGAVGIASVDHIVEGLEGSFWIFQDLSHIYFDELFRDVPF